MIKILQILFFLIVLTSCNKDKDSANIIPQKNQDFIYAVDISSYPEISLYNSSFYDVNGYQKDFLLILKESGVNTVRFRLWVNPTNEHSGLNEVKKITQVAKNLGFKIWITVHYSDTWADPSKQATPTQWQGLSFINLVDSIYAYTSNVVKELNPNYIQIGNEINNGILFPYGTITNNIENFKKIIDIGCKAVRDNSTECKIILHFAGIEKSDWFFDQFKKTDYDIIGLSYYPIWHGKSLLNLKTTMDRLSKNNTKEIIIAETAYPFTLQWNDLTNNIVGLEEQLILPDFPANSDGQRDYIKNIKTITKNLEFGIGFCYWGAELIAWKGYESKEGSTWENQALFDFNNKALPSLTEFKNE
jgi:arabinogalactan endo-1,4-beta-galactosidase